MKRRLRLALLAITAMLAAYAATNFGLAWVLAARLLHPGCHDAGIQVSALPGFEEHRLSSADGTVLRFRYYPSKNGAAIIAMGGLAGALGENSPPIAFLAEQGYGILQADSRACAEGSGAVTLGYREVEDLATGLSFLLNRPEVDPARIGASGYSMGAVSAIRAAARHPEIAAVVAEGGYHNLGEHLVNSAGGGPVPLQITSFTVAAIYWMRTGANPWEISPARDLRLIAPRPVLLIYGEHEIEPGKGYLQYEAAGEPKRLWVVPGGEHGKNFSIAGDEYEKQISEFFGQALLSP